MGIFSDVLLPAVGLGWFVEYEEQFTSDDLFEYTMYAQSVCPSCPPSRLNAFWILLARAGAAQGTHRTAYLRRLDLSNHDILPTAAPGAYWRHSRAAGISVDTAAAAAAAATFCRANRGRFESRGGYGICCSRSSAVLVPAVAYLTCSISLMSAYHRFCAHSPVIESATHGESRCRSGMASCTPCVVEARTSPSVARTAPNGTRQGERYTPSRHAYQRSAVSSSIGSDACEQKFIAAHHACAVRFDRRACGWGCSSIQKYRSYWTQRFSHSRKSQSSSFTGSTT